jgi:tRNA nucleotidyltransferase (CCA-adding enzyme)
VGSSREALAERVQALPGSDRLLPALRGLAPAFLAGGAVRDMLRRAGGIDLDLAVEGDAGATARGLAERLDGRAVEHERFGTATVRAEGLAVDLAATRRERYPRPGALPVVEPAPLEDDLARRDFTINAMAVSLGPADLGRLHDPHGGEQDLEASLIRVLHDRSFLDDPTRLLRAVRYGARLGFRLEPRTEQLGREAIAAGALATVSGPRIGAEVERLLAEAEAPAAVAGLRDLGLDRALHPGLRVDPELVAGALLGAAQTGADRVVAALGALLAEASGSVGPWLDELGVPASARDRALRAAQAGPALAASLGADRRPSELHALLHPEPLEALAVALALGAPGEPVLRYLADLRDVGLEVTGADLVAAGVPESPAVGRALAETLRRKLDGRVSGREEELRLALSLAREEAG